MRKANCSHHKINPKSPTKKEMSNEIPMKIFAICITLPLPQPVTYGVRLLPANLRPPL